MSFFGKIFLLSAFMVIGAFFAPKFIDCDNCKEQLMQYSMKFLQIILKIDKFLKYIGINGFHRGYEMLLCNIQYFTVNKDGLDVRERQFDGVEAIMFDPIKHESKRAAIVHIHGSGWIYYNPRYFSQYLAELSRRLGVMIVSINYRKAPEHPFPVGIYDVIKGTRYFLDNVEKFDVDPDRIALMGESAGGNLIVAAGYYFAALQKVDNLSRIPKILIPIIPALQMADLNLPSFRQNLDKFLSSPEIAAMMCLYAFGELSTEDLGECAGLMLANKHMDQATLEKIKANVDWTKYLKGREYENVALSSFSPNNNKFSDKFAKLLLDPLFSPLSALNNTQLGILPPVYSIAASRDPLRDDAKLLAARLSAIGHPNGLKEVDQCHGESLVQGVQSKQFNDIFDYLFAVLKENGFV